MAITYVGGQTASITASTATNTTITFALTGGLASTPAADDYVIVSYSIGSTVTRTPAINTAGYTQLTALTAADTFDANLRLGHKRMGGTPDTQVQVGPTGATTDGGFVTIHVFRGVDPTTPLDGVTPTTATAANSGTPDPAAITPATANNIIYVVGANGHGTTGTMTASYTTNFLTGQNVTPTNRTTMGAGYVTGQAAGVSYNPAAFTWSANANTQGWCAYTLVLKDTPTIVTGAALISPAATTAAAGQIIVQGAAAATPAATTTVAGQRISLGAAQVSPAATVAAAAQRVALGAALATPSATAAVAGQRLALGAALVTPALTITVDAQVTPAGVVLGSATIEVSATAVANAQPNFRDGVASALAQLLTAASGRLFWDEGAPQAEVWTPQGAQAETWAVQAVTTETWTPQAANSEIWTPATAGSKTWTQAV